MAKRERARRAAVRRRSVAAPAASLPVVLPASRPPIDIGVLTGFLDSLESYSQHLVQHLRSGQQLCHYTTLGGAIGIIESGDLWLTNSRYSNDDEELRYGQDLVEDVIKGLETDAKGKPSRLDWLKKLREALAAAKSDQIYICCFCERNNLLSQWRGYADNGGGVSFEFDPVGFTEITGRDCPHGLMRLWKVFYDREQQREILQKCIDSPYWPANVAGDRIRFVVDALQFFMPTFKNTEFAEEHERRLIFTPYPAMSVPPRFRTRGGLLVPYFSLREVAGPGATEFQLPIASVLVGPSLHRSLNVESTQLLLQKYKHAAVPVTASKTPYRP
ncbi:MAG: DUF2971 domain-containing protein [Vicinamibacterales bacterium]